MPDEFCSPWIVRLETGERLRKLKRLGIASEFETKLNGSAEQIGVSCNTYDSGSEQSESVIRSANCIERYRRRRPISGITWIQAHCRFQLLNRIRHRLLTNERQPVSIAKVGPVWICRDRLGISMLGFLVVTDGAVQFGKIDARA
ncbi:hypothetical protein D9M69_586470 [compost metagenome]